MVKGIVKVSVAERISADFKISNDGVSFSNISGASAGVLFLEPLSPIGVTSKGLGLD